MVYVKINVDWLVWSFWLGYVKVESIMGIVFTGAGKHFQQLESVGLDLDNLNEIVNRVKIQPHFLGEPLIVIGESVNFSFSEIEGVRELLAVDVLGRTVSIIITIGIADTDRGIDGRAMEFAALANSYSSEELGKITAEFLELPHNDQLKRVWEDLGVEMDDESVEISSLLAATFERDAGDYADILNKEQRIIIASEGFSTRVVNEIEWLSKAGVNIKGLRYLKYLVGGQEIFFAEQVVPRTDPSVDAGDLMGANHDSLEPWKAKGRSYYVERLAPSIAELLDRILVTTKRETFSISWAHKYYFWLRGAKMTFRVRVYSRDRLELGFYNASSSVVDDFLNNFNLPGIEIYLVGGYNDSPFVAITSDVNFNDEWIKMIRTWLGGSDIS